MSCIDAPPIPIPSLPGGLTLGPPIPAPSFDLTLCCKLLDFHPHPILPITLGPGLGAALAAVSVALASLNAAYHDLIPFTCPREAGP